MMSTAMSHAHEACYRLRKEIKNTSLRFSEVPLLVPTTQLCDLFYFSAQKIDLKRISSAMARARASPMLRCALVKSTVEHFAPILVYQANSTARAVGELMMSELLQQVTTRKDTETETHSSRGKRFFRKVTHQFLYLVTNYIYVGVIPLVIQLLFWKRT